MERTTNEAKLNPADAGREMKRVAGSRNAGKEPVVVPVVVVAVAVHVALVVPAIERQAAMYEAPPIPPPFEYSRGCILFGISNAKAFHTKYLHFLKCLRISLYPKS